MKTRVIWGVAAISAVAAIYLANRKNEVAEQPASVPAVATEKFRQLQTFDVPATRPRAVPSAPTAQAPITPIARKSTLAVEFDKGTHLKSFYERYAANPQAADAETKFFAATAIETCQGRRSRALSESDRQRFLDRLKLNDPANPQRIEAYDRVAEMCEGFQSLNVSTADASRLYAEAAAAGNPAAKAALAADQYREQARNARGIEERRLSEEQLALVREALASGDSFAIRRAGALLTYESTQLVDKRIGPEGDPFNPRELGSAWMFAACDHGANCGPDIPRVLNGCAQQGACGYTSLQSYMQFNELPPNTFANAQRYSALISEAIAQGRWDWLGIAPGSGRTVTPAAPAKSASNPNTVKAGG